MLFCGIPIRTYSFSAGFLHITAASEQREKLCQLTSASSKEITDAQGAVLECIHCSNTCTTYAVDVQSAEVHLTYSLQDTTAQQLEYLEAENKQLKAQVKAAQESNAMLEECVVEMAGIVYA